MEGMERKHFKRDTIRLISGSLQDILPVRVGGAFVVHTPWWFGWLFSVASVFMKAKLRARMHALGDDVEVGISCTCIIRFGLFVHPAPLPLHNPTISIYLYKPSTQACPSDPLHLS